ncbi:hypothetical protein V7122_02235 [Bacillus sp. JJ1532]|uniref:hypothetical protein n=1 Tax=unclassified Bacillus (in: firmicutes) TaxID=185979 RepID=UPI003000BC5A
MGIRRCTCNGVATATIIPIDVRINGVEHTGTITINANICSNCQLNESFINFSYRDDVNVENNFSFTSQPVAAPSCRFGEESEFLQTSATGTTDGETFSGESVLSSFGLGVDGAANVFIRGINLVDEDGDTFVQESDIIIDTGRVLSCDSV